MNDDLDDDHPLWLVNAQIVGLLEGQGAGEDHENVVEFFLAIGLPRSRLPCECGRRCCAEVAKL